MAESLSAVEVRVMHKGKWLRYERTGKCNGCAECCKSGINYRVRAWTENAYSLDEGGWEGWGGWAFLKWAGMLWAVRTRSTRRKTPCVLLKDKRCSNWRSKGFRIICMLWPTKPADVRRFPRCGFHFKKLEAPCP